MYYSHFGLSAVPFQLSPNHGDPFLGRAHREALAALEWGLTDPNGFVLLLGAPGTGKTSLILNLLERRHPGISIIHVNRPASFNEIAGLIGDAFGLTANNEPSIIFNRLLRKRIASRGLRPVLILDEAQGLEDETLEKLRLLADDAGEGRFALQIVLVGQPDLFDRLKRPGMLALDQRISTRAVLKHLERVEVSAYIDHRLRTCGSSVMKLFSSGAIRALTRYGSNVPREINLLCHNSLILAYASGSVRVSSSMVRTAASDYKTPPVPTVNVASTIRAAFAKFSGFARVGSLVAALITGTAIVYPLVAYTHTRSAAGVSYQRSNVVAVSRAKATRAEYVPDGRAPTSKTIKNGESANLSAARGSEPPEVPGNPVAIPKIVRTIVIEADDSLSSIAEEFLGSKSPAALRKLLAANPQISDANLIHPGEVINLPSDDN